MAPPCLKEHFRTIKLNQTQSNAAATRSSLKADFTQNFSACEKREGKKKSTSQQCELPWSEHHVSAYSVSTEQLQLLRTLFSLTRFPNSRGTDLRMVWNFRSSCSAERGNWHYHQCTYLLTCYLDLIFFKVAIKSTQTVLGVISYITEYNMPIIVALNLSISKFIQ